MKMIPETRCVAKFDIYIFIGISIHILNIKSGNKVVIRKMCGFLIVACSAGSESLFCNQKLITASNKTTAELLLICQTHIKWL